jgi:hypothetical protein
MQGVHLRKYGVEATIDFEVYEVDGVDLRVDWVPAAADCEIMKDGGASTQCTNTATDEGSTYSIVLTATEMQFARGVLKVVDAATKVFLDTVIIIETYGHASAQHAFDLDDGNGTTLSEAGGTGDHLTALALSAAGNTAVIDEFETQSQADPTGFHVNTKEVNGTAQTAGDLVALANSSAAWGSINSGVSFRGTVSADDPGVSFTIGGLAGQGAGAFVDANTPWYAYVLRDGGGAAAAPQGEVQKVTGYTSATGLFTTDAFTAAVATGDDVVIVSAALINSLSIKTRVELALPNAAPDAAGGLLISDDGGWDADELYDAIITDAAGANIAADVIAVKAKTDNIPAAPATEAKQDTIDAVVDAIKIVTDSITDLATLVDAVWDEDVDTTHQTAGSAGKKLDDAGGAADPWATALPGGYGAGTAGKIIGDNINAPIDTVDTVVDAIKAKTDNLPVDPADASDVAAAFVAIDTLIDAIKAKTDNLPVDPADASVIAAQLAAIDNLIDAIKAKTDLLTFTGGDKVQSDLKAINGTTLTGDGSVTPWGPA